MKARGGATYGRSGRTRSYLKVLLFVVSAVILLDLGYFVIGPIVTGWIEHG
jgi:hypothetical protein